MWPEFFVCFIPSHKRTVFIYQIIYYYFARLFLLTHQCAHRTFVCMLYTPRIINVIWILENQEKALDFNLQSDRLAIALDSGVQTKMNYSSLHCVCLVHGAQSIYLWTKMTTTVRLRYSLPFTQFDR